MYERKLWIEIKDKRHWYFHCMSSVMSKFVGPHLHKRMGVDITHNATADTKKQGEETLLTWSGWKLTHC